VDLPEHLRVASEVRVMHLDLPSVGVPDDLPKFRGIEAGLLQIQVDQRGRRDVRGVDNGRFDELWRHVVQDSQAQNVKRCEIPLLCPPLLGPPRLSQDIRHPAEVVARQFTRRPGVEEAADFLLAAGQNIHDDQQIGKVECGVPRVQRLQEAAAHIQFLPELLPAVDGAVSPPADVPRRPAGKAPVGFLPVRDRDRHCISVFFHHLICTAPRPRLSLPRRLRLLLQRSRDKKRELILS